MLPRVLRLLVDALDSDVPLVNLNYFILLRRSIHQLLRNDAALKCPQLTPAITARLTGHQPIKQIQQLLHPAAAEASAVSRTTLPRRGPVVCGKCEEFLSSASV